MLRHSSACSCNSPVAAVDAAPGEELAGAVVASDPGDSAGEQADNAKSTTKILAVEIELRSLVFILLPQLEIVLVNLIVLGLPLISSVNDAFADIPAVIVRSSS